jgi:hypothetical protein
MIYVLRPTQGPFVHTQLVAQHDATDEADIMDVFTEAVVVIAESADAARLVASKLSMGHKDSEWLNPERTDCQQLDPEAHGRIAVHSFRAIRQNGSVVGDPQAQLVKTAAPEGVSHE